MKEPIHDKFITEVYDIPIDAEVVFKAWFPEFRPEVYYCQPRSDPHFVQISSVKWQNTNNTYGQLSDYSCCTPKSGLSDC